MASHLKRKNLMIDEEKLRKLAHSRNLSESEAVRQAVADELALDDALAAWDALVEGDGLADPNGLLVVTPPEDGGPLSEEVEEELERRLDRLAEARATSLGLAEATVEDRR